MSFQQHFFLRGKHLGTAQRNLVWVHAELSRPHGTALFCPICSEVWLLAPIEGQKTFALHVECERHKTSSFYTIPGSSLLSWDSEWNNSLPPELLKRELLLQIDALLKENQNEQETIYQ